LGHEEGGEGVVETEKGRERERKKRLAMSTWVGEGNGERRVRGGKKARKEK